MFIRQKTVTSTIRDTLGVEMQKTTKTLYLIDGQIPDEKTQHPDTQKLYKQLYILQEEKEFELGRPVTIFELFGLSAI